MGSEGDPLTTSWRMIPPEPRQGRRCEARYCVSRADVLDILTEVVRFRGDVPENEGSSRWAARLGLVRTGLQVQTEVLYMVCRLRCM